MPAAEVHSDPPFYRSPREAPSFAALLSRGISDRFAPSGPEPILSLSIGTSSLDGLHCAVEPLS